MYYYSSRHSFVNQSSFSSGLAGNFDYAYSSFGAANLNVYSEKGNVWPIVLAAGEGSRLQGLVRQAYGVSIPKQYCSMYGGDSLLTSAIKRGERFSNDDRVCVVVADQHRSFWRASLSELDEENIIIQPMNRGTANGVLLALLKIIARDADATIVLLPADHHIEDEPLFNDAVRNALSQVEVHSEYVQLLGIEPTNPDSELGYILPFEYDGHPSYRVKQFIEKPSSQTARELIEAGGLWNAFIVVAKASSLLKLFVNSEPEIVSNMKYVLGSIDCAAGSYADLLQLYSKLPTVDFSRHVLEGQEHLLRVLPVPDCGWSDLGTPNSLIAALRRSPVLHRNMISDLCSSTVACLSVAAGMFANV